MLPVLNHGFAVFLGARSSEVAASVSIVPKPAESCRTEIHAFSVSMRTFSTGISASVSSFFKLGPRAFQARQAYSRSASTMTKPIPHR
jgi:hypothetical protein